ncbi:flagellar assembly protein FliW [Paenibacillus sp. KQZ6P-2]|uniref:Flagellar assembly factor FliW n=1 Tax=Paenibacillus mangrovi TaxID=2931978 RepID=A0A9X1WSK9_9BACL|nr:flagellar assembly protein FliW [Paenibacillus mangrovi]MCJ8012755.1 flagellar assembly protein FliW [Paenibacillus mangrovi]
MLGQLNNMLISFEGSIIGFEGLDQFYLEAIEDTPFAYLKSKEDPQISFLTTTPFQWYPDYSIHLNSPIKKRLRLTKPEDTLVLCIVTIKDSIQTSTLNLLAPLIINVDHSIGIQHVIQEKTTYKTNSLIIARNLEEKEGV